jgi:hypothetical protein
LPILTNSLDLNRINAEPVQNSDYSETLPHSLQRTIVITSDEDDLTRKMDSLIQALGSPGASCTSNVTPYANGLTAAINEDGQGTSFIHFPTDPNASPVKPLDFGKARTRQRSKSHRFSPFKKSPKKLLIPNERGGGQRNANVRPPKSSSRIPKFNLTGKVDIHDTVPLGFRYWPDDHAAAPPPSEYLPSIKRFSSLFPDEANAINDVRALEDTLKVTERAASNALNDNENPPPSSGSIRSSKSSKSSQKAPLKVVSDLSRAAHHLASPTRTMVPAGIFKVKKSDKVKVDKENKPITNKSNRSRKEAAIAMSDTAKARNLLMQHQQLPRVVVRPPSAEPIPFRGNNSNTSDGSNSDFLRRPCI